MGRYVWPAGVHDCPKWVADYWRENCMAEARCQTREMTSSWVWACVKWWNWLGGLGQVGCHWPVETVAVLTKWQKKACVSLCVKYMKAQRNGEIWNKDSFIFCICVIYFLPVYMKVKGSWVKKAVMAHISTIGFLYGRIYAGGNTFFTLLLLHKPAAPAQNQ